MAICENDREFKIRLDNIRGEVKEKFSRAHQVLQDRENALLQQLREIELNHRKRDVKKDEWRQTLLLTKENLESSLKENEDYIRLESLLTPLEENLKLLGDRDGGLQELRFEWDGELENILGDVGRIITGASTKQPAKVPDYKNKGKPVLVACKCNSRKSANGKFNYPTAITIHSTTGNIYICDLLYHRIQVFSKACEFLFLFSDFVNSPAGIEIHENALYVTQFDSHSLCKYADNGKYLLSVGKKGFGELQFNQPHGLAIDGVRKLIYICDQENNRIQVLNLQNLTFQSFITDLKRPKDIKIRNMNIFVLDDSNPCVHIYNAYHLKLRQLISYGKTGQVERSYHFTIDQDSNFLFTDDSAGCVSIFTREGNLVHKLGKKGEGLGELIAPRGIAIDSDGRLIVASRNPKHCIQFF